MQPKSRCRSWSALTRCWSRMEALQIPARYSSDLMVAKSLTAAAKTGALENVRINLDSIQDADFRTSIEARLGALKS